MIGDQDKGFSQGPYIMGIVNVTPDSFSDGGLYNTPRAAIDHAHRLIEEGAHILDIGGESTRPGAAPVSPAEEQDRILPVIEALKDCGRIVSVDTRHAATMAAALAAGAGMINDITALTGDAGSLAVLANSAVPVCLMHMQGTPQSMQENPHYNNVVQDVFEYLAERIAVCEAAGIARARIIIDPGVGFGKNLEHNISLIRNVSKFKELGCPLMVGLSRKRFIDGLDHDGSPGRVTGQRRETAPEQRVAGSLAAALWCYTQGVKIFRVHDVAQTRQALAVYRAFL